MNPGRRGLAVHGILLLDKPAGLSSSQAVTAVKRLFRAKKAGHTGSLDPFATGMLPVCLGHACKTAAFMLEADKLYRATARLGQLTNTGDIEGEVVDEAAIPDLDELRITSVLQRFVGAIEQVPPMYSALKHGGQPLYRLARAGKEVPREARTVFIHDLRLVSWQHPLLEFDVHCSKGTYVRTLAEDLARALGTVAHLQALRRRWVEPFAESAMISLDALEEAAGAGTAEDLLLPADAGLMHWPAAELAEEAQLRFRHGNPVILKGLQPGLVRVYGRDRAILGLGEIRADGRLYPRRVFGH